MWPVYTEHEQQSMLSSQSSLRVVIAATTVHLSLTMLGCWRIELTEQKLFQRCSLEDRGPTSRKTTRYTPVLSPTHWFIHMGLHTALCDSQVRRSRNFLILCIANGQRVYLARQRVRRLTGSELGRLSDDYGLVVW